MLKMLVASRKQRGRMISAVTRQPHRLGMPSTISRNKDHIQNTILFSLLKTVFSFYVATNHDIVTTVSAPHTQKVLQINGKKGKMGKNKWRTIVLVIVSSKKISTAEI